MSIGRALRDGLLGKARALFHGLGPKGEYPSRKVSPEIDRAIHSALLRSFEHVEDL